MQRRRGLASQNAKPPSFVAARPLISKRIRSESGSGSDLSSSESSSSQSGPVSTVEDATGSGEWFCKETVDPTSSVAGTDSAADSSKKGIRTKPEDGGDIALANGKGKGKGKSKGKADYSDESKWKKIRVRGSEEELTVAVSSIQKYVDHDAAGVASFQKEVEAAKGNYRQQATADYSDL